MILSSIQEQLGNQPTPFGILFHLANVLVGAVLYILLSTIEHKPKQQTKWGNLVIGFFLSYIGLWSMLVSLNAQTTHGQITVYLIGILSLSVIIIVNPIVLFTLILGLNTIFRTLLPFYQTSVQLQYSHLINTSYFMLICLALGFFHYQVRVKTFVKAIELQQLNARLEQLSTIDPLTGIYNRRKFDELVAEEWRRATREKEHLTIAVLDIDNFKIFNDQFGHLAGDECLKNITTAISNQLKRPGDSVSRFGGEEFALILPHTDIKGGEILCDKIREAIENLAIQFQGNTCSNITISIGLASVIPQKDESYMTFFRLVDCLLYEAKRAGKNQIKSNSCICR
ncbi:MAG: GGDEF domain-containing protein [Eubacteriales bacterium]|nr:GGDEF domain-containing protein [Eubacteriales bacterium]